MRPLKLELEGFTAFRRRICIDFKELDLFAITGPTGAGKSSLIDAICYALYGATPRMRDKVGACISPGLDRMQVTLEFLANGARFRVLRETRRKGAGNTRLEQADPSGEWGPLSDRAREVTQMVERIVGLDFEAFTRSALLPQGQFQEFLAGSPDNRRDVLRRLLRMEVYERMQSRAGQEAGALQQRVNELDRRLREELADATPEALAQRRQELRQTGADRRDIEQSIKALQDGLTAAKELSLATAELAERQAAKDAAEARLATASGVIEGGDARLTQLRGELVAIKESLERSAYDDQRFAALTGAANLATAVERATKGWKEAAVKNGSLARTAAQAEAAAQEAAEALAAAQRALAAAEAAFEEARRHNLAASLQIGLKPGDACPVCGGTIGELVATPSADLEAARAALEAAHQVQAAGQAAAAGRSTQHAAAVGALEQAEAQTAQLAGQLTLANQELDEALPPGVERSLAAIQAALATQRAAREEHNRLQKQDADLTRQLTEAERDLASAKDAVTAAAAESRAAGASLAQTEQRYAAALAELTELIAARGWATSAADLEMGHDPLPRLDRELGDAEARQAALLTQLGALEEKIHRLEQDIDLAKTLREELTARKRDLDVAADLALMLRADRFQAFVQAEALRSLAEDGTRKLLELSAGRYELEVAAGGQDFVVKDKWNADDVRSVRTLSGGETFLASLALALSLAETLPGLAPGRRLALDSIFLDEGFGSLDAEALDRAADALDALRMDDRLVCVITHLNELAERMPARIMVNKTEEGSTVTVL
jgi:exonuclease SbcC